MATIGTFKKDGKGFSGSIETLTIKAKITIEPVEKKKDNAPDFRVCAMRTKTRRCSGRR